MFDVDRENILIVIIKNVNGVSLTFWGRDPADGVSDRGRVRNGHGATEARAMTIKIVALVGERVDAAAKLVKGRVQCDL